MRALGRCSLVAAFLLALSWGCSTPPSPPVQAPPANRVEVADLIAHPDRFGGAVIRATGWCRIEFEGSALYPTRETAENRDYRHALRLVIDWPVSADTRALDGKRISVDGRVEPLLPGDREIFAARLHDVRIIDAGQ